MKKIITAIISLAAISFAADVQVLAPTGAEFSPDAPNMVQSLVRASVTQSGNTLSESSDIQLRTNIMTMGSSIVVVCEQVNNGSVVASGKQKAGSIDELDMAIEGAVKTALANLSQQAPESAAYAPAPTSNEEPQYVYVMQADNSGSGEDPNDNFAHKRPTRNYVSYGLGMALWHNYTYKPDACSELEDGNGDKFFECADNYEKRSWEQAFVFHYARIFEVIPQAAITIVNNMNMSFGDEWQWHETFLIAFRDILCH